MMNNKLYILALMLFSGLFAFGQNKYEREYRIKKSQFPTLQTNFTDPEMKKIRFYKEVDSAGINYSIKFKMDRLRYHLDYDESGNLVNSGFRVKEVDIPAETYSSINQYLSDNFGLVKIRRIWQQYPVNKKEPKNDPLKDTFQNMMLPSNLYKVLFRSKGNGKRQEYEAWFDPEGEFIRKRTTLPANYDRVLY